MKSRGTVRCRWLMVSVLLMLVSGCAIFSARPLPLLASNSHYELLVAQQQWHVRADGTDYRLQAIMQINDTQWTLVLLDSLGQRIATLVQDGQRLDIQRHKSHPLNAHLLILAQRLQFSLWPLADLQQQALADWSFATVDGVRQVYFSGILNGHISYSDANPWQGTVRYTHNKGDFRLVIESRQLRAQER